MDMEVDSDDIWFHKSDIRFDRRSQADKGGSCVVYVGTHVQHGKVALKRMTKWGNVQKEVTVWKELRHVNVLPFLGVLVESEFMYLISPWVENGSLCAYLAFNPTADRIRLLKDVAEGLAYLHDHQIVHGDVKGLNVLISRGVRAMLCDFGLSKQIGYSSTETRDTVGTLPWMSPERMLGGGPGRSFEDDVYAFSIVISEALRGQIPFVQYTTFSQIVQAVCDRHERPDQVPSVSASGQSYDAIWAVASSCWVHQAQDRPSMSHVLRQEVFANLDCDSPEVGQADGDVALPFNTMVDYQNPFSSDDALHGSARKRPFGQVDARESPTRKVPRIDDSRNADNERLRELLKPAVTARHDAKRQVPIEICTNGTRTRLLDDITQWALSNEADSSVFLINGMAGLGKSTIAKTIAMRSELRERLGATFFFSRREGADLRTADTVIRTLTYQLAQLHPAFGAELLARSRVDDPADWVSVPLDTQFKRFYIALRQTPSFKYPPVVILDAFDECEWPGSETLLSLLLAMAFPRPPNTPVPLKFLITSRPEIDLMSIFHRYLQRKEYILHEMDHSLARSDICLYLRQSLRQMPTSMNLEKLPSQWFAESDLEKLTDAAGSFFIYAATAVRIIEDRRVRNPKAQLRSILAPKGSSSLRYSTLDTLYLSILLPITTCTNPDFALEQYQSVVGALAFLRDRLSVAALSALLALEADDINSALVPLQSIIVVPSNTTQPPTIYHASFIDYITSDRCCEESLRLVTRDRERYLTIRCLSVMTRRLKQNMANIRDSTVEIASILGLKQQISPEICYAALHWASHLAKSSHDDQELLDLIDDFASRCLLWWIEVSGVLQSLDVAIAACQSAVAWLAQCKGAENMASLINDGCRLMMAHGSTLVANPLQLYTSILALIPRNTALSKMQASSTQTASLSVRVGRDSQWPGHLALWTGHTNGVSSLDISPDGTRVVSGSLDKTVRIWDVASGSCTSVLDGHSYSVTSVAFSPDGTRVVSGSRDQTLRMWDVASGSCTYALEGHSEDVTSVAFSPDGTRVVSGSDDNTVRIWDSTSGNCASVLEGHSSLVTSVAFSPDGTRVVSGSNDQTVRIWDVASESCTSVLEGHTHSVTSMAFSPDGTRVVSGSWDKTVRIWDVASGSYTSILEGHSSRVRSVAFSPDGTRVVSRSFDEVIVWQVNSDGRWHRDLTCIPPVSSLYSGSICLTTMTDRWLGYLNSIGTPIRICRLPPRITPDSRTAYHGALFAAGSPDGVVTVLDVSALLPPEVLSEPQPQFNPNCLTNEGVDDDDEETDDGEDDDDYPDYISISSYGTRASDKMYQLD